MSLAGKDVELAGPSAQASTVRASVLAFYGALAFTTALFVQTLSRSLPELLSIVPDDAFYYLTTARNIATHNLSSFDGINPTNGYHPGWMAMMVVCAKLFSDPTALLRASMFTAFLFHVGSAFVLARALKEWVREEFAFVGGALWVMNPLPVNFAIEGMEGCLYIFALSVAFFVYSTRIAPHIEASDALARAQGGTAPSAALGGAVARDAVAGGVASSGAIARDAPSGRAVSAAPSLLDYAWMGASLSFCFYGRTEAVVLAGFVVLAVAFMTRGSGGLVGMLVMGITLALGVAPWFVYSHWATGDWFQHSGSMKMLWAAEGSARSHTRVRDTLDYLFGSWMAFPVLGIPGGKWSVQRGFLAAAVTACLGFTMIKGLAIPNVRRPAITGLYITAVCMLTGLVYALFFSEQQYWYKAQPSLVLFTVLYVAVVLTGTTQGYTPARAKRLVLASAAVMALTLVGRLLLLNSYPWQKDVLASQLRFDSIVPEGEVIGCFNAGIPGYFGKRVVVNLDGLMNNPVYDYYKAKQFDRYLTDAKIHYIADEKEAVERGMRFVQHQVPLDVVETVDLPGWYSGRRYLWRVGTPSQ